MNWKPASVDDVQRIVQEDLLHCDAEQATAFRQYSVEPYSAAILRLGNRESVVVVARKGNEALYWEDIEEGFNISPLDAEGSITEQGCEQDSLGIALDRWIGRR